MSWFDATGFANLAKTALKEAQKTIDKALDITEEDVECNAGSDTTLEESKKEVVAFKSSGKLWDTFAGSFFEKIKVEERIEDEDESKKLPELSNLKNEQVSDKDDDVASSSEVVKRENTGNRLSVISSGSDRKSTLSVESVDVLGSNSTISPDSDPSSRIRDSGSYESSVDILSSSSVEVLNDESSRITAEGTSSESVDIIPELDDEGSMDLDNSHSENTLTAIETEICKPTLKEVFVNTSLDASLCEVLSPWEVTNTTRTIGEMDDMRGASIIDDSCDESTVMGSSSDDLPIGGGPSLNCSIKSMIADAIMEDEHIDRSSIHHRESSPSSSGSRNENRKAGSSDHTTSGDELETAASSDIEIISNFNGDSSSNAESRQSPAKLIYKDSKGKMSVVLSSDILIPEIVGKSIAFKIKGHKREPSEASSATSEDSLEIDKMIKKITELTEVLEMRESKLVELSMKNAQLSESNSNLKSQLECQSNEEYSRRINALEKRYQQSIKEKDALKKQLENYKKEKDNNELDEDNKDEIIKELREEGEKLSKQQLTANTVIKKLRATDKEREKLISTLTDEQNKLKQELERISKSLKAKEDLERNQVETINQLTKIDNQNKKQITDLQTNYNALTSTIISSQKEIEKKKEEIEKLKSELEEGKRSLKTESELKIQLEVEINKRNELEETIKEMRGRITMAEEKYRKLENTSKMEKLGIMTELEESKGRNEKLAEEIFEATRSITKQLQDEVNSYRLATNLWQKQEQSLTATINEQEEKLKKLRESEYRNYEQCQEKCEEIKRLQDTINDMDMTLQKVIKELELIKEMRMNEKEKYERIIEEKSMEIEKLKMELEKLDDKVGNLNEELMLANSAKDKLRSMQEHFDDMGISGLSRADSPTLSVDDRLSASDTINSSPWQTFQEEDGPGSSQRGSVYDFSRPIATTTSMLENLQSQMKQREGEVQQLQWELNRRDHERNLLTNEITRLTANADELQKRLDSFTDIQTQYEALLQMYGEKMEENQELKMDLMDVKEMYKAQIDQLLEKMNSNKTH